jgi:hypothetical protein
MSPEFLCAAQVTLLYARERAESWIAHAFSVALEMLSLIADDL